MFWSFFRLSASCFRLEEKVRRKADRMRMETITVTRQAGASVFLVTLMLSIQCAGIAPSQSPRKGVGIQLAFRTHEWRGGHAARKMELLPFDALTNPA
jgi:hypothetical protein